MKPHQKQADFQAQIWTALSKEREEKKEEKENSWSISLDEFGNTLNEGVDSDLNKTEENKQDEEVGSGLNKAEKENKENEDEINNGQVEK